MPGIETSDRARELAVYLNRVAAQWRRTQYEPVDDALISQAVEQFVSDQRDARI